MSTISVVVGIILLVGFVAMMLHRDRFPKGDLMNLFFVLLLITAFEATCHGLGL